MDMHAEYVLKCPAAARWLNTPRPVSVVDKCFLDAAHAITTTIVSTCYRAPPEPPLAAPRPAPPPRCDACSAVQPPPSPCPAHCPRRRARDHKSSSPPPQPPPTHAKCPPAKQPPSLPVEPCVAAVQRPFPCFTHLSAATPHGPKSLLYVPVQLHDHFVFGVVLGCPVPPPHGVHPDDWKPLVTRFVLDGGRKCCLMFSYFAEGSIVVLVDCFDVVGDHFSEITFFEPTPVVGAFPRGIRGRMHVFEKRDCPRCTTACVSCACPVNDRVQAIVKLREKRARERAGASYEDENVTIRSYPYWAQILDEYKFSRLGSYCVQIRYTPTRASSCSKCSTRLQTAPFRTFVTAEARTTVDKMLRGALLEKGVSAVKPACNDDMFDSTHTMSVSADGKVTVLEKNPFAALGFNALHKLPGFQEDYLLIAPSNIVSGAHARAQLARVEAEQAARQRASRSVLPEFGSASAAFAPLLMDGGNDFGSLLPELHSVHTERDEFHATGVTLNRDGAGASQFTVTKCFEVGSDASSAGAAAGGGASTSSTSVLSCDGSCCVGSRSGAWSDSCSNRDSKRKRRRKQLLAPSSAPP